MRKLVFGLLGFAALGFGALSVQPAAAQPYYPGYGYRGPAVGIPLWPPCPGRARPVRAPLLRTSLCMDVPTGLSPRPHGAPLLGRVPAGLERLPLGAPSDRGLPHGRQARLPLLS